MSTYALIRASANVVWQTGAVVWVAHEDGGLDGGESSTGEGTASSAAEGVVHDLTTLSIISMKTLLHFGQSVPGSSRRGQSECQGTSGCRP